MLLLITLRLLLAAIYTLLMIDFSLSRFRLMPPMPIR